MVRQGRAIRLWAVGLLAFMLGGIGGAAALDYPVRPVHWVVAYPPGGTTDILARLVGHERHE